MERATAKLEGKLKCFFAFSAVISIAVRKSAPEGWRRERVLQRCGSETSLLPVLQLIILPSSNDS